MKWDDCKAAKAIVRSYLATARSLARTQRALRSGRSTLLKQRLDGNVIGLGIGFKETAGKTDRLPCVRLYVQKKLPLGGIPAAQRLPKSIDGVPTDVLEWGLPSLQDDFKVEVRPLQPGYGVSHEDVLSGTIGLFVRPKSAPESQVRLLLSCSHVLAPGSIARVDDRILQPAQLDGGLRTRHHIASLKAWTEIKFGNGLNRVDAAIAVVRSNIEVHNSLQELNASLTPENYFLRSDQDAGSPVGQVLKRGRTTGLTFGMVEDFDWEGRIRVADGRGHERSAKFCEQLIVKSSRSSSPFSDEGDSGALVVEKRNSRAIGLVIAGERLRTVVTPLWRILETPELGGLEILTPQR